MPEWTASSCLSPSLTSSSTGHYLPHLWELSSLSLDAPPTPTPTVFQPLLTRLLHSLFPGFLFLLPSQGEFSRVPAQASSLSPTTGFPQAPPSTQADRPPLCHPASDSAALPVSAAFPTCASAGFLGTSTPGAPKNQHIPTELITAT